jgi:hypothetical protein
VSWTGRGGGRRGDSAAHGGDGRWSSCSGETAVRPEQHATQGGPMGPREDVSVLGWWG